LQVSSSAKGTLDPESQVVGGGGGGGGPSAFALWLNTQFAGHGDVEKKIEIISQRIDDQLKAAAAAGIHFINVLQSFINSFYLYYKFGFIYEVFYKV